MNTNYFDNFGTVVKAQFLAIVCALIIWLMNVMGFFNAADALIYDYYTKLTTKIGKEIKDIIIVEYNPSEFNLRNEDWETALDILEQMHPKEIVLAHLISNLNPQFWTKAAGYGNVVVGRKLVVDPKNPDEFSLEMFPEEVLNTKIKWGVVGIPSSIHGLYRSENLYYQVKDVRMEALETVVAREYLGKAPKVSKEKYIINYSGGIDRLPKINLQKILKKEIIPELFANKIVMIGSINKATDIGLNTPGSDPNFPLSLVEFQSFAVDTLVNNKAVVETGFITNLLLFLFVAMGSFIIYSIVETTTIAVVSIVLIGVYSVFSFLSLQLFNVWPPLAELVVEQIILFGAFFTRKSIVENLAIRKMIVELTQRINQKVSPPGFHLTPEYWKHVITMVDQVLSLNKTIFLEKIRNDHRVKEVVGLRCSINDIAELRRDYERTPYSTAIKENKPIILNKYFKNSAPDETEYLLPLISSGDVMGFWAFTLTKGAEENIHEFEKTIVSFGEQIALLLTQRQIIKMKEENTSANWFYYWFVGESVIYEQLKKAMVAFNRQLTIYENIFDGLSEASILYDLFGRVLKINKLMAEYMQSEALSPYRNNSHELICALTGLDAEYIKKCMKHIILDQRKIVFPARLKGRSESSYILSVRNLGYHSENLVAADEAYPFHSLGILLELIDVTKMSEFYKIKERVLDRIKMQYSNDLQSVLLGTSLIVSKELDEATRLRVVHISSSKIKNSVNLVTDAQRLLDVDLQFGFVKCYPIDPKAPVMLAKENLNVDLYTKNIVITTDIPDFINLVYASQNELANLIKGALKFLVEDAVEGSEILIILEERGDNIIYTLKNKGFGMPNEHFQSYLFTNNDVSIQNFNEIRDLIHLIHEWGGEIKAYSEVGVGSTFIVELKGFM